MTAEERNRLAIDALISAGEVINPWVEPIQAVGKALGLSVADSLKLVDDLCSRDLVRIRKRKRNALDPSGPMVAFGWWEEVKPGAPKEE
jgi:hypothetical protein